MHRAYIRWNEERLHVGMFEGMFEVQGCAKDYQEVLSYKRESGIA